MQKKSRQLTQTEPTQQSPKIGKIPVLSVLRFIWKYRDEIKLALSNFGNWPMKEKLKTLSLLALTIGLFFVPLDLFVGETLFGFLTARQIAVYVQTYLVNQITQRMAALTSH